MPKLDKVEQSMKKPVCDEHHWVSRSVPGLKIPWVVQCSICKEYNVKDMNEQIQSLIDAKVAEARIDELESLLDEEEENGIGFRSAVKSDVIHERLAQLTSIN